MMQLLWSHDLDRVLRRTSSIGGGIHSVQRRLHIISSPEITANETRFAPIMDMRIFAAVFASGLLVGGPYGAASPLRRCSRLWRTEAATVT